MRRISWLLLVVVTMALVYYFLVRPFEFEVNLKANTLPGDLIETIRIWNRSIPRAEIVKVDSFSTLTQTIPWKGKTYFCNWHFVAENDSVTKVSIQVSEPGRSFLNKLLIPFTSQQIEKDAADIARNFYDVLKGHLMITRVRIHGESELRPAFCVCTSIETRQTDKANGMMRDYGLLTTFIDEFKLKLNGVPMVRVKEWRHSAGTLKFDFCFPIVKTDSLPVAENIHYEAFQGETVLKAEYNGNYITSDRAWYELAHYADKHGYEVTGSPIEYFFNNPNLGVSESEWKAEVYLPVSRTPHL